MKLRAPGFSCAVPREDKCPCGFPYYPTCLTCQREQEKIEGKGRFGKFLPWRDSPKGNALIAGDQRSAAPGAREGMFPPGERCVSNGMRRTPHLNIDPRFLSTSPYPHCSSKNPLPHSVKRLESVCVF